jgi:hypothetical protein
MEAALGTLLGDASTAGCGSLVARALLFPDDIDISVLLTALGAHHFDSWNMAREVAYVAAFRLQSTARPAVPPMTEALSDDEYAGLAAAVVLRSDGAASAFVAEARRQSAITRIAIITDGPEPDIAAIADLDILMQRLARMCRFDRTGDAFLLSAARAMLPSAAVSSLAASDTPYAISRTRLPDSNSKIGGLFREPPAELLERHASDSISPIRLSLMMALAAEYIPALGRVPPLFINSDIGPAHTLPAIYLCTHFDCGAGDAIIVATGTNRIAYRCVTSAVLAWAAIDPSAHELYAAIVNPAALDPTSVFARLG